MILSSCNYSSDDITGSQTLTNSITGKYTKSFTENHGSYSDFIRDTIIIIKKDHGFEIQNHVYFSSSLDDSTIFTKVPGFPTFQGVYNKTDSSITHPSKGSLKFNFLNNTVYSADNPSLSYLKSIKLP